MVTSYKAKANEINQVQLCSWHLEDWAKFPVDPYLVRPGGQIAQRDALGERRQHLGAHYIGVAAGGELHVDAIFGIWRLDVHLQAMAGSGQRAAEHKHCLRLHLNGSTFKIDGAGS